MAPHQRQSHPNEIEQQFPKRVARWSAVGVSLFLLLIYRLTIIPTVVDQDSGELVSACHVLGIAHPTGYPLWVLLGRGFDLLPLGGTSAYRVAMLSAVCTAAAAGVLTYLAARMVRRVEPAAAAGLAFGLWYPAWSQAVRAEVYGLTALLVALALAAFLRWHEERSPRWLAWLGLACGFVSMHHRTAMLAVAPALLVAAVLTRPRRARAYVAAAGLFLAPFVFYAYLPIRAAAQPPVNWTNPVTWGRFWDHLLATQYQGYAFSHTAEQMAAVLGRLLPELLVPSVAWAGVLAIVGLTLAGWGFGRWATREPIVAWPLAAGAALLVFWVLQWGETSDLKVFFPPAGQVAALCAAIGLGALMGRFRVDRIGRGIGVGVGLLLCVIPLLGNWERADLSNLWQHRDRWAAMLSMLEPDAVYVSDNDVPSFATMYLQNVEGLREDVTLIRVVPLELDWYVDTLPDGGFRETVSEAYGDTQVSLSALAPMEASQFKWERTALFARHLSERLDGGRPVYALHGSRDPRVTGPPYFVGITQDLVAVRGEWPELTKERPDAAALAEYPGGVELVEFDWDRTEVATGELLVGFRTVWQIREKLTGPLQFVVGLAPATVEPSDFAQGLKDEGFFMQAFPLISGRREILPSPEGTVYVQRGEVIVPTNCPAGPCLVAVGVGPLYTPAELVAGWNMVGELDVRARPKPSNGP